MDNMTQIIIILAVVVVLAIVFFVVKKQLNKKKRLENFEGLEQDYNVINETHARLIEELERTKKISKNEECITLYNSWTDEFNLLNDRKVDIDSLIKELKDYLDAKDNAGFNACFSESEAKIHNFNDDLDELLKRVKGFTDFELESTRISLTLIDRIRELKTIFEQKLEHMEIYNSSFYEQLSVCQEAISEFESLQKKGEYQDARTVLRDCNRGIDKIEFVLKVILNFQEYLIQLDNDIVVLNKIGTEITNIGFSLNIKDFDTKVKGFVSERQDALGNVTQLNFASQIGDDYLSQLENRIKVLDQSITEFKDIVEEKFNFIKEIIEVITKNDVLIQMASELIDGARNEKQVILSLYELPEIKQVQKLETEIDRFEKFKGDYSKLLEIIHNAKEDFVSLKSRAEQSNAYLVKLIKNIELAVSELKSIRNDELSAIENTDYYKAVRVDIELYLRSYDHLFMMSNSLRTEFIDFNSNLEDLETELAKEPLNIDHVRNLNNTLDKLATNMTSNSLDNDVKQRLGSKLLLEYIQRYNSSEEMNLMIKRMHEQYREHEYKRILKESYDMILTLSDNGDAIYKKIVSQVNVKDFEPILLNNKKDEEIVANEG